MVGYALDELIKQGKVDPASRVELADSRIGMVVKQGAPPAIDTEEALKRTLLNARSLAYSDSASGSTSRTSCSGSSASSSRSGRRQA